jgi:hypothetical protein
MSSVESGRLTSAARLFILTAALEAVAGLTLLVAPATVSRTLFGSTGDVFQRSAWRG